MAPSVVIVLSTIAVAWSITFIGSPSTVSAQMRDFVEQTQADELMVVSQIYDQPARRRSYEIAAATMAEPTAVRSRRAHGVRAESPMKKSICVSYRPTRTPPAPPSAESAPQNPTMRTPAF